MTLKNHYWLNYYYKPYLLQEFIGDNSLDIITLTETWFQPDTPSNVINSIVPLGYSIINSPRNQGRGGGLAFIHRSNFQTSCTKLPTYSSFGSLCVKFSLLSASCTFLLCTVPLLAHYPLSL